MHSPWDSVTVQIVKPKHGRLDAFATGIWQSGCPFPTKAITSRSSAYGFRQISAKRGPEHRLPDDLPSEIPRSASACGRQDGTLEIILPFEIIVFAKDVPSAQLASTRLYLAEKFLNIDSILDSFFGENITPLPLPPHGFIDRKAGGQKGHNAYVVSQGFLTSAKLAAKAGSKATLYHCLARFYASRQICGVAFGATEPKQGQLFGVRNNSIDRALLASALPLAYAIIEELGFEPRPTKGKESHKGQLHPEVKAELEQRLTRGGINPSEKAVWILRGPPNILERERPVLGTRANWNRGKAVRDKIVPIVDAIARASWLRSKTSAHRINKLTRSLTAYDVWNVQMLARRLVMTSAQI